MNGRRYGESRERRAGHGASPILRQPDGRHEAFTFRASAIQNWNTSLILHPWYWLRRAGRYRSSSTIEGQSSLRNLGAKPEPPLSPQDDHLIRIPLTANRLASVCDA